MAVCGVELVTRAEAASASGLPGLANRRTLPVTAGVDSAEPAGTESCEAVVWGLERFTCKVIGDWSAALVDLPDTLAGSPAALPDWLGAGAPVLAAAAAVDSADTGEAGTAEDGLGRR